MRRCVRCPRWGRTSGSSCTWQRAAPSSGGSARQPLRFCRTRVSIVEGGRGRRDHLQHHQRRRGVVPVPQVPHARLGPVRPVDAADVPPTVHRKALPPLSHQQPSSPSTIIKGEVSRLVHTSRLESRLNLHRRVVPSGSGCGYGKNGWGNQRRGMGAPPVFLAPPSNVRPDQLDRTEAVRWSRGPSTAADG